ncbi:MAG: histidinol-phosphate transaminase [Planctomycetaceae bacterium]|jgi:histidinol-phosphate aminotransferase|nr:histidinol-phosphate transaminase [Planctomycetaceae bacterium]
MCNFDVSKYVRADILSMNGYVAGEQPLSKNKIIKLNTNENPYRASDKVYEAIRRVSDIGLSRYPDSLATKFREIAAQKYNVDPAMILCGNGSDDILTILTRTFVGKNELLRLPYPTYILYRSLAEIQGAKSELIHFNNNWSLPDEFYLGKSDLRLAFLPNPNSPSGTIIPKKRILEIAENLPCPLVVDEAYIDFAESGSSCVDLVKSCERLIVTRTLSKSYSLAGLRFGYLIAAEKLVEQMLKVKDSYNCDSISIAAAIAAISDDSWLDENRKKIISTRNQLTKKMRNIGFNVPDSNANCTWNTHTDFEARAIYDYLKSNDVLVRYMNYPSWGDGLRISVGTDEQIDQCVNLISQFIRR